MELENKIIELRKGGMKYVEISKQLGCSKSTISKYCKKNNISDYTGKTEIPNDILIQIQEKYDNGETLRNLSKEFGYGRSIVTRSIVNKRIIKSKTKEERKKSASKNVINWRQRKKQDLVEYKGGKCLICSYNKSIRAMEFHHINPLEKDFGISGKSWSFERLKQEVDKCILVCSNCHCEIHDNIIDISKYIPL